MRTFTPLAFEPGGDLLDQVEPDEGLPVAAEDDLLVPFGVADGLLHLGGRGFVLEPEVMSLDREVLELGAEDTGVGAAVGDVEVEGIADPVGDFGALVRLPDAEEAEGVQGGDPGHVLQGQALYLGDHFRGVAHIGRLVASPPVGLGCQVGTVGFHQHAVDGDVSDHLPGGLVPGVGDGSGKGEIKAHIEAGPGHVGIAAEAVEDPADLGRFFFLQDFQHLDVGLPVVHDDRKPFLPGQANLAAEGLPLRLPGGAVAVVVEADLADRDSLFLFVKELSERFNPGVGGLGCVVGMDADGGVNVGVDPGDLQAGPGAFDVAADREDVTDALPKGAWL